MKNAEISLEEARRLYKSSTEAHTFLLSKFTKEELENKEITQEAFDAIFDGLLKQCVKTIFLKENGDASDIPTCRFELQNSDGLWLFDIDYGTIKHFWFDYDRVYQVIKNQTNLQIDEISKLMIHRVNDIFKIETKPMLIVENIFLMVNDSINPNVYYGTKCYRINDTLN